MVKQQNAHPVTLSQQPITFRRFHFNRHKFRYNITSLICNQWACKQIINDNLGQIIEMTYSANTQTLYSKFTSKLSLY